MKKVSLKMVMKRAWEIAKEAAKKFGGKVKEFFAIALKMAWKEVKMLIANEAGNINLVGTEKQVAWANDIRNKYMKVFDQFFNLFSESKYAEQVKDLETAKKEIFDVLFNKTDAKYYIEEVRKIELAFDVNLYIANFLSEQLKDLIKNRHVGAAKFRNFFANKKVSFEVLQNIIKNTK